jgi:hypothetical protein
MERIGLNEGKNFRGSGSFSWHREIKQGDNEKERLAETLADIKYLGKVGKAYKKRFDHASHKHPSHLNHTSNLRKGLMKI